MSLNSPLLSRRSAAIADRFAARARAYESHAGLQADVARHLAGLLPERDAPKILELGCGTGLLSRHLLARYPDGDFVLTDAAPGMLDECRRNLDPLGAEKVRYEVMDAGAPGGHGSFDLIATSMTLHWVADPLATLEKLRGFLAPGGQLLYAALGPDSFVEWRTVLAAERLPCGSPYLPEIPGVVEEDRLTPDNDSLSFLLRMKAVGGLTPREGYAPLTPGALRRALRVTNERFGGRVTWHIVYGRLERS